MLDFPNAPTTGQVFNSGTGPVYIWDGVAWNLVTQATATAETSNRVYNPVMQISQENGDAANAVSATGTWWPADQWCSNWSLSPGTVRSGRSRTTDNINDYIFAQIGTAKPTLASSDYIQMYQPIEGNMVKDFAWGTSAARQVVLRFNFYSTITGTFAVHLANAASNRCYIASFTVATANAWQVYTVVVPGDTTGTWATDNTVGVYLVFGLAAGSGQTSPGLGWVAGSWIGVPGMTNGAATAGNFFAFSEVGLYADPLKTGLPPAFVVPDHAEELARCQRYVYVTDRPRVSYGYNTVSGRESIFIDYPVQMRTTPTVGATFAGLNACSGGIENIGPLGYTAVLSATAGGFFSGQYQPGNFSNARMI